MNKKPTFRRFSRREFLSIGSLGALAAVLAGSSLSRAAPSPDQTISASSGAGEATLLSPSKPDAPVFRRLVATDGHILLPGRAEPLFIFGFREVLPDEIGAPVEELTPKYKGNVQMSAPILDVQEGIELFITVTNIGLVVRPDLADSHTLHWHGFRNPIALFDGVPEVSIAVPPTRDFPYYFNPRDAGTYMYHCHFEDVEHVQMGMNGIVFVRPNQDQGTDTLPAGKYIYNDGDGSTAYEREFTLMLNEIDTRPHDLLENVQEFVWTDYKANYWTMNGRAYPHTVLPNNDPSLPNQPISSLIQVNEGDRVALRMANLGYEQHAMQLAGIQLKVVGHDATLLRSPSGTDISYFTNTIYIGPGEARDAIFIAPAFDPSGPVATDTIGQYNRYFFKNRNLAKLSNGGVPGLGGMVTEIRVYANPLPAQTVPNETYT